MTEDANNTGSQADGAAPDDKATQPTATTETKPADSADTKPDTKAPLGGAADKPITAPADWPTDWRDKLAGGDEKVRARLERFASPADVWKHARALESRQGEMKAPLPKDATDEQKAQWRKDNGIPETPDKYDLTLGNGLALGEADKPIVDEYLKYAHETNQTPEQVKTNVEWFLRTREAEAAQQEEKDHADRLKNEETLRAEWGQDFRRNVGMAKNLIDTGPEGLADKFYGGRTADGTPLENDPTILNWLVGLARAADPLGSVMPGAGANAPQAIGDEIARIEGLMRNPASEYWSGPKVNGETKMAIRYRELISAREKVKAA